MHMKRGQIYIYDAVGFLLLYLSYITIVVCGRYMNQRSRRKAESSEDRGNILANEERNIASEDLQTPGM